jgi:hypothetical protein
MNGVLVLVAVIVNDFISIENMLIVAAGTL